MKLRTVNTSLVLLSCAACILYPMQSNPSPQNANAVPSAAVQSIYRNFLGRWDGSSERIVEGHIVRESVEIVITEEPRKHRIQLDYLYHGEKGTTSRRRFLQLDPAKEKMKLVDVGFASDQYDVSGLKQFAETGLGDFTADQRGEGEKFRVTFHLGVDTLNYEWASAADGKTYETFSRFSFRRKM